MTTRYDADQTPGMQDDAPSPEPASSPPSDRVRVRRIAERGRYDAATIRSILDDGIVAHVGVQGPDGPVVLPMAYGRTDDTLYLHGAVGNALLGDGVDAELCATVTLVDGLVLARTPFHNSMNYRCVVVRGRGRRVEDPAEHELALRVITDHVVATWDHGRPPSSSDLRRTLVLALPLTEASAKVRSGDPVDEPQDMEGPHWAGTVAVTTAFGPPVAAADLAAGIDVPATVRSRFGD
jgi:nitroimidazol reductase NimA-like FMN-containing flavoprotein (pyridoxamine 5'-phosphate oxidase superfamily)